MKRQTLVLTLISALLLAAMAGSQLNSFVKGNVMIGIVMPAINVISPTNTTYRTNNLSLRANFITITTGLYDGGPRYENTRSFTYRLDGKHPENITITEFDIGINPGAYVFFEGYILLTDLAEGLHNLTVRADFSYSSFDPYDPSLHYAGAESIVYFRIDTIPQNISLLHPENKSYFVGMPLEFGIDEPALWIGYSLDGKENVTIIGNMTLLGISVGQHTLTLYANDTAGNPAVSKTITFKIADLATPLLITGISVFAVGSLVYFKKHKR